MNEANYLSFSVLSMKIFNLYFFLDFFGLFAYMPPRERVMNNNKKYTISQAVFFCFYSFSYNRVCLRESWPIKREMNRGQI